MDTMLSKALRKFMNGPLKQLIVNISGRDGDQWEQELQKFNRKEPCWTNDQCNEVMKLLKKQAGEDALGRFLRGEITVSEPTRSWREEDGVIYFSVTSPTHEELLASLDPTEAKTAVNPYGEAWIKRLEGNGFRVGYYAKQVLRSPGFKPTSGVTTEVAVLKGMLFKDNDRITKKIRAEADKRKLLKPNTELACLIREKFTDKEIEQMGLWYIVAMHEPINDSDGGPGLLRANRRGRGRWLNAYCGVPGNRWLRDDGFAFAVSQVSSQH